MVGWPEASHGCDLATVPCCLGEVGLWFITDAMSQWWVKLFLKPQTRDGYDGTVGRLGALQTNSQEVWEGLVGNGDILSRESQDSDQRK